MPMIIRYMLLEEMLEAIESLELASNDLMEWFSNN